MSIASVALAYELNANLLRRWLVQRSAAPAALSAPALMLCAATPAGQSKFVPVKMGDNRTPVADICIEIPRGPTAVSVGWPTQEAAACAAWLCEWLR